MEKTTTNSSTSTLFSDNSNNALSNITSSITNSLSDTVKSFSNPTDVNSNNPTFLNSNGIIAKIVFLILVIIIFMTIFFLLVKLIGYYSQPSSNPMLIKGQINGTQKVVITQNPSDKSSITISRSNNETTGIEFTWSVWLSISKTGSSGSNITPNWHSPVFVKGDISLPNDGVNQYCSLNNGPGVYFGTPSDPNHLYILMDTVETPAISSSNLVIDIPNLPTDYFHLAVKCLNTNIDVYINGNLVKRHNLLNVPKQNYYDIAVCPYNGFNGLLSNLQYFNYGLSVIEINKIVKSGPNTTDVTKSSYNSNSTNAISTLWYNSFL
jgi:hypothetical protein